MDKLELNDIHELFSVLGGSLLRIGYEFLKVLGLLGILILEIKAIIDMI